MTLKSFYSAPTVTLLALLLALMQPLSASAQNAPVQPQVLNAPASGQSTQALLDRLDRLERDIRTLNQQIAGMPTQPASAVAPSAAAPALAPALAAQPPAPQIEYTEGEGTLSRVMVRFDALESEVRTATGQS